MCRNAIVPKGGGFLDVNFHGESRYATLSGEVGIGYDWKNLRRFRLADGAAVTTLSKLQRVDEADDMWIADLLGPSDRATGVIASVAFCYATEGGGASCVYRACDVDVTTGVVAVLRELHAAFL